MSHLRSWPTHTTRIASVCADLFHKLQTGILTLDELALFTQCRNPFGFERNEHGHTVIGITGLDLTGAQEIERLETAGYRVHPNSKPCLTSTRTDCYDKNHLLVAGRAYQIAIVRGSEIVNDFDRTTTNLRKLGEECNYAKPLGGIIPRIRETISDTRMQEMGISYIASLHDPIKDSDDAQQVLSVGRRGDGRWVYAYSGKPDAQWDTDGAFAFPICAR